MFDFLNLEMIILKKGKMQVHFFKICQIEGAKLYFLNTYAYHLIVNNYFVEISNPDRMQKA